MLMPPPPCGSPDLPTPSCPSTPPEATLQPPTAGPSTIISGHFFLPYAIVLATHRADPVPCRIFPNERARDEPVLISAVPASVCSCRSRFHLINSSIFGADEPHRLQLRRVHDPTSPDLPAAQAFCASEPPNRSFPHRACHHRAVPTSKHAGLPVLRRSMPPSLAGTLFWHPTASNHCRVYRSSSQSSSSSFGSLCTNVNAKKPVHGFQSDSQLRLLFCSLHRFQSTGKLHAFQSIPIFLADFSFFCIIFKADSNSNYRLLPASMDFRALEGYCTNLRAKPSSKTPT